MPVLSVITSVGIEPDRPVHCPIGIQRRILFYPDIFIQKGILVIFHSGPPEKNTFIFLRLINIIKPYSPALADFLFQGTFALLKCTSVRIECDSTFHRVL